LESATADSRVNYFLDFVFCGIINEDWGRSSYRRLLSMDRWSVWCEEDFIEDRMNLGPGTRKGKFV
jgi:hypothetical protein